MPVSEHASRAERAAQWQRVLNERPVPPRGAQRELYPRADVTVWVAWERDGLELVDTRAEGWAGNDVHVWLPDRRREISWIWLDARDVRRR